MIVKLVERPRSNQENKRLCLHSSPPFVSRADVFTKMYALNVTVTVRATAPLPRLTLTTSPPSTFISWRRFCWRRLVLERHFSRPRRSTKKTQQHKKKKLQGRQDYVAAGGTMKRQIIICYCVLVVVFFLNFITVEEAGIKKNLSTCLNKNH